MTMADQTAKAADFRALHVPGQPLLLFNVWDAGSAKAVAGAGARALATGSWSVAAAQGFADGERFPFDLALDIVRRIVATSDLPLSFDLESGYGADAAAVGETAARAVAAGAVGCNIEDSFPETGKLRPLAEQVERLGSLRAAADAGSTGFFVNARTDVFFQAPAGEHDGAMAEQAIERARAFADAGADGLFVPGLVDARLIAKIVAAQPLPVNVMMGSASPAIARLAEAGVARISHGPGPYLLAMKALGDAARGLFEP
jgi:2-methylisocitrate lyase-like PEP mutase family enzyme